MTDPGASLSLDQIRQHVLDAALCDAPFDGWTDKVLSRAAAAVAEEHGLAPSIALVAFPEGVRDLLHFWSQELDVAMLRALERHDLEAMKIRERVTFAVRTRIELMMPHRAAAYRAFTFLALPHNAALSMRLVYGTVDAVWHGIGDRSTDFNFYTKRATLAGVYASTLLFWIGDDTPDAADTWAFLDRRIADVMTFERTKAEISRWVAALPSPLDLIGARPR